MAKLPCILKGIVTAIIVTFLYAVPLSAQTDNAEVLDQLFVELAEADAGNWEQIEQKIWSEWSRSGSAAMDLLLERGRAAMEVGDLAAAIEHLTALTDHAPDFAEGWNARIGDDFRAVGKRRRGVESLPRGSGYTSPQVEPKRSDRTTGS
jgi:hypothetical protein